MDPKRTRRRVQKVPAVPSAHAGCCRLCSTRLVELTSGVEMAKDHAMQQNDDLHPASVTTRVSDGRLLFVASIGHGSLRIRTETDGQSCRKSNFRHCQPVKTAALNCLTACQFRMPILIRRPHRTCIANHSLNQTSNHAGRQWVTGRSRCLGVVMEHSERLSMARYTIFF